MNSDGPEHWTGTTETYVIAEEFDFEGRGPPPDGRSAMAEKALDRMMAEVSKRHQMESDWLSMNITFSGVLMTMSAALLVYLMNRDVSVCWMLAVLVSIASIVPGIIEIHTLSLRHDGIQIGDMVEEFNRHNYELVSYLLFNSNARIVSQFKAMNLRIVKTQKYQILLFVMGMVLVLMMEVVD